MSTAFDASLPANRGYDGVAKTLHWLIVALLIAQYALGWAMPEIHRGAEPVGLILWHLEVGMIVIAVALMRLIWRIAHPVPPVPHDTPHWQHVIERATHILIYVFLVVLPVMGWLNASKRGWSPILFGIVPLPQIVATGSPVGDAIGELHILTSYVFLAVIALHVGAVLYHQLILRDRILKRMLPGAGR